MTPDDDLPVRPGLVIPADELDVSTSRAGGPGGQNVNKLSTRVTLRWSVATSRVLSGAQRARLRTKLSSRLTKDGDLIVVADAARSQLANRREVRQRLAGIVDAALTVPKTRRPTRPTKGSKRRRLRAKKRRSDIKRMRGKPGRDES